MRRRVRLPPLPDKEGGNDNARPAGMIPAREPRFPPSTPDFPKDAPPMRHVISALVTNEPGVLANVAGMFAARGFNIDSLVVGRTEDAGMSRMTVVVDGDDNTLQQVQRQLAKLVPVSSVRDLSESAYVERDLVLVTVAVGPGQRSEVLEIVSLFRARAVDVGPESLMVEIAGTEQKLEALVDLLRPYGITELARTGVIAMARGVQPERGEGDGKASARVRSMNAPAAEALPPS